MSKLAIEPEIGEFTGGYKPMFVKKSQEKMKKMSTCRTKSSPQQLNGHLLRS